MNILKKFWHNFKAQPDVWFFYGFLITFTLSIRKVVFFYPISGQFNEYSGIYLYLSDIFLILTIILWVIYILKHKYSNSSSNTSTMFHVEHFTKPIILIPLILIIWSFISTGWADNKNIAVFRSAKLLEFYLLYIYIAFNVPRLPVRSLFHVEQTKEGGIILRYIFQIIIFFGLFQAIIGIWQFIIQKSIGLFWLKESLISPEILGVAKVILGGEKFIRSYGLFPHPNILGGFLLFSIISTFVYYRMFHPSQNVPCGTSDGTSVEQFSSCHPELVSGSNKLDSGSGAGMTKFFLKIFITIQFIALLLSFSKSAILGLVIALIYIYYKKMFHPSQNVPRGTSDGTSIEHTKRKVLIIIGIILVLAYIIKPDINSLLFKSLDERALYANVSRETISAHPLIGLGSGQFIMNMQNYSTQKLEFWQYQPVHNVLLLIWSELGIIGFGLFLWWIWKLFHVEQKIQKRDIKCSTWNNEHCEVYEPANNVRIVPHGTLMLNQQLLKILKGLLLGVIFIMLFDHYFWDIQQGQILFWLLAGLIAGIASYDNLDINT